MRVCFLQTANASRVAGAPIHDGCIARKDDRRVLADTCISVESAEDPLAEAVVHHFQSQIDSAYQHSGDNVLFMTPPARCMSSGELAGYSQKAPALLVQLEARRHEFAVLYGYLAPVNAFGSMTAD
jgi:hypothetical protein